MQNLLYKIFNGEMLFGKHAFKVEAKTEIRTKAKEVLASPSIKDIHKTNVHSYDRMAFTSPSGYIYLRLIGTSLEDLAKVHKISMDYLRSSGDVYVKNLILNKTGQSIDLYHNGENKLIEIAKATETLVRVRLEEVSGAVEEYYIELGIFKN